MLDNAVTECIERETYPVETRALAARVGELDGAAGSAIERAGTGSITSANDALLTLLCGLDGDAVGRRHYSDRDFGGVGESRVRQISF
ncbi:MAG: hypothetical protein V5A23_07660 [Halobacteriales archaeon]